MFTGLIQEVGLVNSVAPLQGGLTVSFRSTICLPKLNIGDSVAINGVCSTVVKIENDLFFVEYLPETLAKTTFNTLGVNQDVNLECCLTASSYVGGHFVSGHVDCKGSFVEIEKGDPWWVIRVSYDPSFFPYIVDKGSIAIDGVSLTVVDNKPGEFSCHLIGHTISNTIFSKKIKGDEVNLEFDISFQSR